MKRIIQYSFLVISITVISMIFEYNYLNFFKLIISYIEDEKYKMIFRQLGFLLGIIMLYQISIKYLYQIFIEKIIDFIKKEIFDKIIFLLIRDIDKKISNEDIILVTRDLSELEEFLQTFVFNILVSSVTSLIYFYMILEENFYIFLITLISILVYVVLRIILDKKLENLELEKQYLRTKMSFLTESNFVNFKFLVYFSGRKIMHRTFAKINKKYKMNEVKNRNLNVIIEILQIFLELISLIFILVLGLYLISINSLSLASLTVIIVSHEFLINSTNELLDEFTLNSQRKPYLKRIYTEYLNANVFYKKSQKSKLLNIDEIEFENFSPNFINVNTFENFNKKLSKNNKYIVKGNNGVGKSSLIMSLLKEYPHYIGNISVNGINLNNVNKEDLLENVAFYSNSNFLNQNCNIELNFLNENKNKLNEYLNLFDVKKSYDLNCCSEDDLIKYQIIKFLLKANRSTLIIMDEINSSLSEEILLKIFNEIEKIGEDKIIISIEHSPFLGKYLKTGFEKIEFKNSDKEFYVNS